MDRNQHLKRIQKKLDEGLGSENYPRPLVGDIDCLSWQVERLAEELSDVLADEEGRTAEEMTRFLWKVRHTLRHQIGPTVEDVVAGIDKVLGCDSED
jgi:hypothetical protein